MAGLFHSIEQKLLKRCTDPEDIGIRWLKIEALLVIAPAILVFLGISGSFRRHCGNGAFAMVNLAAYNLTPAVIAYTLGLFQSAPFCSPLFPVWATYPVAVLGNVDSYTAHSMEDIERWKSVTVDSAVKCIITSWMIATYAILWRNPLVCILFMILFLNVDERAQALMLASNSVMQKKCSLIADYMSTEHQWSNSSDEDPATMRGYRYLVRVAGEAKVHSSCSKAKWRRKAAPWLDGDAPHYRQLLEVTDEVITDEKVWNCKGRLLSVSGGDRDGRLKDLCLSFSLFKFICLRFTGFSLPREAHNKLWCLIQHMLSEENGYERVFQVIEVELAFLFDLFYTKYPVNLHRRPSVYKLLLFPIVVAVPLILLYDAILDENAFAIVAIVLLLMSILVVKLTQFGIMIFSEWAKGQASLRLNDLYDVLSWACNLETTTHVIVVWHIATAFCEHEVPRAQLSQEQRDDFDIATKLSQYLAYLVAFAPRLLPGHPCRTEYIFGRAVSEARELVGGSLVSMEERIQKLKKVIDNEQYQKTSVGRGARLGMQLVNGVAGEGRIWKVLADFWADMLLYVAPLNDTAAHGKYLTTRGEFVTHIWVLVSHAGITRDPHDGEKHDDP
ncbi:hypothetical protein NL676_012655 [Syzygium grande]|nr:hypothetical protein NL676_012655 [Syzygium grande]